MQILKTYVALTLLSTFASSFIWGINTLFLLDAGLSITEAFAANAFFTAGQVIFEVPTGAVADTLGRRVSYLLGSATLFASTIAYVLRAATLALTFLVAREGRRSSMMHCARRLSPEHQSTFM